ncbi:hypothetical protein DFH08DRAFT_860539 [Mycena albidolilacea]|uniref:C2H2-type domain-containing protein n=1 Tax=Mycena albidolilacea TaxID=1033008 RepID=A0AAD7A7S9_9AGAR|nr:hypothetical protein DFH08DRAFT_860539 [Mycena albidolilacea]
MEVDGEEGEEGEDGEGPGAEEGKKHVCPTCAKRFNRPSSLRIHVNTHTGATPFRCPHPSCGRAFNVNSNMRRHYRNHASGVLAPASHGSALAAGSPVSPVSPRWGPTSPSSPSSASSTSSRFSPPTPEPLALSLPQPHAWPPAPGKGTQMRTAYPYSESDVRSERRWR